MSKRTEAIEQDIERVWRRIERIQALFDAGEYSGEIADAAIRNAFDDLSELQTDLEEQIRSESEAQS